MPFGDLVRVFVRRPRAVAFVALGVQKGFVAGGKRYVTCLIASEQVAVGVEVGFEGNFFGGVRGVRKGYVAAGNAPFVSGCTLGRKRSWVRVPPSAQRRRKALRTKNAGKAILAKYILIPVLTVLAVAVSIGIWKLMEYLTG